MPKYSAKILMLTLFALPMCLIACSSRPKLLPNDVVLKSSKAQVDKDIDECLELADTYADDYDKLKTTVENTAKASVAGAAAGAVGGAIVGNAGRGTAVGAASAAVFALLNELYTLGDKDPTYQRFAEYCLIKRGYEIAGWK